MGQWTVMGYDTFAGEWYPLASGLENEPAAQAAATKHLADLERLQPSDSSGGPSDIQDRVYIVGPDGVPVRFLG